MKKQKEKSNNRWKLKDWNQAFADVNDTRPPMSGKDIADAIKFLRKNNYPMPEDCPGNKCLDVRPACLLGICRIAVGMCGDF